MTSGSGRPRVAAGLFAGLLFGTVLAASAVEVRAQDAAEVRRQAERLLGRPLTDEDVLRLLRASGLTPEEVRDELEARGFARTAADPYLRLLEGRRSDLPRETNPVPLLEVLGVEDVEVRGPGRVVAPTRPGLETPRRSEIAPERTVRAPGELPVFGRELFERATSQFQPVTAGPVPPDYRLGPGDEIVVVLTGEVEQAYELSVSREGWIVIPDVGRVFVNGRTLAELEEALFQRLSEVYSGVRRGPEATTFLEVSLGELRSSQVYVIGEVEQPSAYEVSSLATALDALYLAGGPTEAGSFREVRVNRAGAAVRRIDLYDYLLRGDAAADVRLEQGDVVFVPPASGRVSVDGSVVRPARYEIRQGENLADAIRFAGGLLPDADIRRVQIERILPPEEREPGRHRTLLDVGLSSAGEATSIPLRAGDRVTLFAVLDDPRNEVTLSGGVWRPGMYAAGPGTTLWDVIEQAGGLLPDAYEARAQIQRLEEDDHTRRMIPVSLALDAEGEPVEDPALQGQDQVFVFAKRGLREDRVVSIGGWVREPGVYPFSDGMTIRDLVLKAGGVRTGAYLDEAEVSRVVISQSHTDTLTRRFLVPLDSSYAMSAPGRRGGDGDGGSGANGPSGVPAPEFALENLDAVYVRRAPGFEPQQNVILAGQVVLPGPYSLQTRSERLTDLIGRAGGLTPEAYPEGLQLWRAEPATEADTLTPVEIAGRAFGASPPDGPRTREDREAPEVADTAGAEAPWKAAPERIAPAREAIARTRVGVDFVQALRRTDGPHNVLVEPNDSIFVPRYIPTVEVRGAVGLETKVLYREGADLDYYIDQAGGYADDADRDRTRVRYANGEVRTRDGGFLFFGGGVPDPDPGSQITVPVEPPRESGGLRMTELVGILTSVATAAATVIIATR